MEVRNFWRLLRTSLLVLTLLGLLVPGVAAQRGPLPPVPATEPAMCQVTIPGSSEVNVLNAVTTVPVYRNIMPRLVSMWAVGYAQRQTSSSPDIATLTEYFNGRNWQLVPSPNLGQENVLTAVSAYSESDVWAVGYAVRDSRPMPLAMHYDGAAWKLVAVPTVNSSMIQWEVRLTGVQIVSGLTDHDAVAVGYGVGLQTMTPLAFHYDGSTWQPMPLPAYMMLGRFTAVAGDTLDDLWAVGTLLTGEVQESAYLFHHTAKGWAAIVKGTGMLTGLAIHGERIFTVGHVQTLSGKQTLVMAYTASTGDWNQIKSFNQDVDHNFLTGVVVNGGKVYAVGYAGNGADDVALTPLVLVYTGDTFVPVMTPNPNAVNELHGATIAKGVLWAVGTTGQGMQRSALVLTNNCTTTK